MESKEYLELARESGGYSDIELDMLEEFLRVRAGDPDGSLIVTEIRDGRVLAAFAATRREGALESTFTVAAACVGPNYTSTEAPANLLAELEGDVLRRAESAILRIETSTAKSSAFPAGAVERAGFSLIGHIPDFYAEGNDYFMYVKHLSSSGKPGGDPQSD